MLEYPKESPGEVEELKSWKVFTQTFGDIYGKYMEIEFDSMGDYERYVDKAYKNKEFSEIVQNQMLCFVPETISNSIWNPCRYFHFLMLAGLYRLFPWF